MGTKEKDITIMLPGMPYNSRLHREGYSQGPEWDGDRSWEQLGS